MAANCKVVGLDPGFGALKLGLPDGQAVSVPNVVGVGSVRDDALNPIMGARRRRRLPRPRTVVVDGATYLVGERVSDHTNAVLERQDMARFAGGPDMDALLLAAVHALLGPGEHTLRVVVGLPVQVLSNQAAARRLVRAMQQWMHGVHVGVVDGEEVRVVVCGAVAQPQPLGAFWGWGFNEKGRWIRDQADLKARIGVADIGFNTLDLYVIQGLQHVPVHSRGHNLGTRQAAETLIDLLESTFGITPRLDEADAILRDGEAALAVLGLDEEDVAPLRKQALASAAAEVINYILRVWKNPRQFRHVLLTGGGALLLGDSIRKNHEEFEIVDNAPVANAVGLARIGTRINKWPRVDVPECEG